MTSRTNNAECPNCAYVIYDATNPVFNISPQPGDFTICFGCHDIFRFGENLILCPLTESDIAGLPLDGITRYQRAIGKIMDLSTADMKDHGSRGVRVKL